MSALAWSATCAWAGLARVARHAVSLHRHRTGARRIPAWPTWQRQEGASAHVRTGNRPPVPIEAGLRGPVADGPGHQGSDRQQGRAAFHPDQHRQAAAGVPAAGRPHRHLAEDSQEERDALRAAAGAGGRQSLRAAAEASYHCAPTAGTPATRSSPDIAYLRRPGPASARRR